MTPAMDFVNKQRTFEAPSEEGAPLSSDPQRWEVHQAVSSLRLRKHFQGRGRHGEGRTGQREGRIRLKREWDSGSL